MPRAGFAFACFMVGVAGCGNGTGNGSQGFGVGGAMMCGQVSPCGGDLTGTWNFAAACITAIGIKDLESVCPGLSVDVTSASISGTATFNSDMTYTLAQTINGIASPRHVLTAVADRARSRAVSGRGEAEVRG